MTVSLLEKVRELTGRKRQSQEEEDLPSGVKKGKAKETARVSLSGDLKQSSSPEIGTVDGSMASACVAEFSPSKLLGMASKMTEFARSSPLTRSSADAKEDEADAELGASGDLSKEEEPCVRNTIPPIPDSWSGDSLPHSAEWENGSVSCLPIPMSFTSNRDRLQQHRLQVAGHVTIPDSWAGEQNLLDWIETEPVEEALRPLGLMIARAALVEDHSNGSRHV